MSNQRIEAYWSQLRKSCTGWISSKISLKLAFMILLIIFIVNAWNLYLRLCYKDNYMLFVILGTVIELETQIPLMQQSVQLDGQTSFTLHVVITIYIQVIIKTLSCYITICKKAILASRVRFRPIFLNWQNWQIFWWMKII